MTSRDHAQSLAHAVPVVTSMEIIKIAITSGIPRFVFSLEPLEVIAFYYAFSPPYKYSPLPGES